MSCKNITENTAYNEGGIGYLLNKEVDRKQGYDGKGRNWCSECPLRHNKGVTLSPCWQGELITPGHG